MNRLVLIGNGFDLAHGLKTSYANFINWYWEYWGHRLLNGLKRDESDELCSFTLKDNIEALNWAHIWGWHCQRKDVTKPWDVNEVVNFAKQNKDLCDFQMSPFLERICKSVETKGWVDIENEYYSLLVLLYSHVKDNYLNLNKQLECLRDKLVEYLREENNKTINKKDCIIDKISAPIKKREIAVTNNLYSMDIFSEETRPSSVMLLSFNYTRVAQEYESNALDIRTNYIHGKLNNPQSIIFGYGDELDEGFQKLKEKNENEALRHIKSIRYLEADNYRRMLEFIESGPFQVCIMGHSCGNSDRTLLNTLFEHKNCVSIKPYYYIKDDKTDNYLELVQNISRNFTDMKLMRDRVVNKTYCEPLTK